MDESVNTSILKLNLEIPNFQAYFLPELLSFDVNAQIYFYSNRYKDSSLCMVTWNNSSYPFRSEYSV